MKNRSLVCMEISEENSSLRYTAKSESDDPPYLALNVVVALKMLFLDFPTTDRLLDTLLEIINIIYEHECIDISALPEMQAKELSQIFHSVEQVIRFRENQKNENRD